MVNMEDFYNVDSYELEDLDDLSDGELYNYLQYLAGADKPAIEEGAEKKDEKKADEPVKEAEAAKEKTPDDDFNSIVSSVVKLIPTAVKNDSPVATITTTNKGDSKDPNWVNKVEDAVKTIEGKKTVVTIQPDGGSVAALPSPEDAKKKSEEAAAKKKAEEEAAAKKKAEEEAAAAKKKADEEAAAKKKAEEEAAAKKKAE